MTEAVSRVTWSCGKIDPGQFTDFAVSLESVPTDTDELVFMTSSPPAEGGIGHRPDDPTSGGRRQVPSVPSVTDAVV